MDIKLKAQVTCVLCGANDDDATVALPLTLEIDRVPMSVDLHVKTRFTWVRAAGQPYPYADGYCCPDCYEKRTK